MPEDAPNESDEVNPKPKKKLKSSENELVMPTQEEILELNALHDEEQDLNTPKNIKSKEKERSAIGNLIHLATEFIKKPTKKAKIALSMFIFLLGFGYVKKDDLIEWGSKQVMQNPLVMKYFDDQANKGHKISDELKLDKIEINASKFAGKANFIEFKGNQINLIGVFDLTNKRDYDKGQKIPISDPYIKNLIEPDHQCIKEATNPERFKEFIKKSVEEKLKDPEIKELFKKGEISTILDIAIKILNDNVKYDSKTQSWLKSGSDKRLRLRWGQANPIESAFSADNIAVDELLMDRHSGICRHFSETLGFIVDEIKTLYPNISQNVYVTAYHDAFKWHAYNMVLIVKSPKELDALSLEPQSEIAIGSSPAYELMRTLKNRNMISTKQYLDAIKNFIDSHESLEFFGHINAIIDYAKQENRPDVLLSIKNHALRMDSMYLFLNLTELGIFSKEEFTDIALDKLKNINEDNARIVASVKDTINQFNDPALSAKFDQLLSAFIHHPDYNKITPEEYISIIRDFYYTKLLSKEEFFNINEKYWESKNTKCSPEYLDFLLSNKEYLSIAKRYLQKIIQDSVDFPFEIMDGYKKNKYLPWSEGKILVEPLMMRITVKNKYRDQLNQYEQSTGENLYDLSEDQFEKNLDIFGKYIDDHPRKI